MSRPVRAAVYGEVNMNIVDGSSVWLQSVTLMLASIPGVHVTLLLRAREERDLLTAPLRLQPNVSVAEGPEEGGRPLLDPAGAATRLAELEVVDPFDVVVVRGMSAARELVAGGTFDGRLWLYYVPPHAADAADADLPELARACDRLLCQTGEIRELVLAAGVPEEKVLVLPPMIPPLPADVAPKAAHGPIRSLLYAGKLSPEYYALELVALAGRLREALPGLELHVVGDKIHNPPARPDFRPAVEAALRDTPGLVWHGAVPRGEVRALVATCDVAFSLRHPSMDSSSELSTKVLEYGSAGVPVLLNRNRIHELVLGSDYPLFASDLDEAFDRLVLASEDPALREEAAARCLEAARRHTFDVVAPAVGRHVLRSRRRRDETAAPRILLAGHDLKFARELREQIEDWGCEAREDIWFRHAEHDEAKSRVLLEEADVVFCEWCLGNAVFYSANKREGQRLVVRFHRMELETRFPGEVDMERVDAMVFVADHVLERAVELFSLPRERLHVVPNTIDTVGLGRPKLPGASFNLGFVGYVPALKRLDRALDILERVRAHDGRFRLVVKGRPPWEYAWMLAREEERAYYEGLFARVERSPLLREAVVFEEFDPDVASYLQKVGFMLSTSDIEGHAVALGEAMASGCVPVVFERPGARSQYAPEWVHDSADGAARAILDLAERRAVAAEGRRAAAAAREWSVQAVMPRWRELLGLAAVPA